MYLEVTPPLKCVRLTENSYLLHEFLHKRPAEGYFGSEKDVFSTKSTFFHGRNEKNTPICRNAGFFHEIKL